MAPRVGIILRRRPQILPKLDAFTSAYISYKSQLQQNDARPFPQEFYYKKGSLAEKRFLDAQSIDEGEVIQAIEPELLEFMSQPSEIKVQGNELQSLDRLLDQNLYLMVRNGSGYEFPVGSIKEKEYLHDAARRELYEKVGNKLDVNIVGRVPVAHVDDDKDTVLSIN